MSRRARLRCRGRDLRDQRVLRPGRQERFLLAGAGRSDGVRGGPLAFAALLGDLPGDDHDGDLLESARRSGARRRVLLPRPRDRPIPRELGAGLVGDGEAGGLPLRNRPRQGARGCRRDHGTIGSGHERRESYIDSEGESPVPERVVPAEFHGVKRAAQCTTAIVDARTGVDTQKGDSPRFESGHLGRRSLQTARKHAPSSLGETSPVVAKRELSGERVTPYDLV